MSGEPLKLGVVGAGTLAQRVMVHLSLDDVAEAVRVVNICDPVVERAAEVAARHGVIRATASLDELLADPEVQAVTIASPIGLHYEQGLAAIAAGKHVHFNKTLSVTTSEATELIEAARAAGVHLVASPGEVLRPHLQHTRELIEAGALGTLTWAACGAALGTYHESEPERAGAGIDPSWYFRVPGGGPLYDMTVYALHGLTGVLGSVRRVTAMSGVRIAERSFGGRSIPTEAHDNTLMLLDFGDSLFALAYGTAAGTLNAGSAWDPSPRFYGTAGEIVGRTHNGAPLEYPGSEVARARAAGDPGGWQGDQWLLPHAGDAHGDLLEAHVFEDVMQLVDLVRDGVPTPVTAEHARHVVEIIEAAYRAAETGVTQTLTTALDVS
jgi:predicted dehydrogenase